MKPSFIHPVLVWMNPTAMDGEVRSDNLESHCGVDIWKLLEQLGDLLRESHGRLDLEMYRF